MTAVVQGWGSGKALYLSPFLPWYWRDFCGRRDASEAEVKGRRVLSPRPKWGSAWRCKGLISNEWMKPSAKRRQWGLPVSGQVCSWRDHQGRAVLVSEEMSEACSWPALLSHSHPNPLPQSHQRHPTLRKYPFNLLLSKSHLQAQSPLQKHYLHLSMGHLGRGMRV